MANPGLVGGDIVREAGTAGIVEVGNGDKFFLLLNFIKKRIAFALLAMRAFETGNR